MFTRGEFRLSSFILAGLRNFASSMKLQGFGLNVPVQARLSTFAFNLSDDRRPARAVRLNGAAFFGRFRTPLYGAKTTVLSPLLT